MIKYISEFEATLKNQARWVSNLRYEDLPDSVIDEAQHQLISGLGAMIAGLSQIKMEACPSYPGESPIFGTAVRMTRQWSALLQGSSMAKMEMDEGNWIANGHVARHFLPALLVEAEDLTRTSNNIRMKDIIVALVAAYEITTRWMCCIRTVPEMDVHNTAGTLGCSVAVGKLLNLNTVELYQIMMLSESLPQAAARETFYSGNQAGSLYNGLCNFNGINAVDYYRMGWFSSPDSLASVWSEVLSFDRPDFDFLNNGLGSEWLIKKAYYQTMPCYRHISLACSALLNADLDKINLDQIEKVDVYSFEGIDSFARQKVDNYYASLFSAPVMIAMTLLQKGLKWTDITDEAVKKESINRLASKVFLHEEPCYHRLPDEVRWTKVILTMNNGNKQVYKINDVPGDWNHPLDEKEIIEIFCSQTANCWDAEQANLVANMIRTICPEEEAYVFFSLLGN